MSNRDFHATRTPLPQDFASVHVGRDDGIHVRELNSAAECWLQHPR
jgi:hypothetical protein